MNSNPCLSHRLDTEALRKLRVLLSAETRSGITQFILLTSPPCLSRRLDTEATFSHRRLDTEATFSNAEGRIRRPLLEAPCPAFGRDTERKTRK